MSLRLALAHLARAGITAEVLAAEHVDPADPEALLGLADALIRGITDGDSIGDHAHLGALTAAREALLPDGEHRWRASFAARLAADLEALYVPCTADAAFAA